MPQPSRIPATLATTLALLTTPMALAQAPAPVLPSESAPSPTATAASVARLSDVPYGTDRRQRMDIYHLPSAAASASPHPPGNAAPVIFMVHGGAWTMGDKALGRVVQEKVARWVPRGFVVVSMNYRLLPKVDVLQQARDVATALTTAQQNAAQWGADASRFILMGHSAGAHLVALVNAAPAFAQQAGARAWLGTVALDSAALDVPAVMAAPHPAFYDAVFGADPAFWRAASPYHALQGRSTPPAPFLLVCSTRRTDGSCRQADAMAQRAQGQGGRAQVLPQPLTHGAINAQLGLESAYTRSVEAFMASLDAEVARRLP
jgi:acetyl esterase/lipase